MEADIDDCDECGYTGEAINISMHRNENLKSHTCPVCLHWRKYSKSGNLIRWGGGINRTIKWVMIYAMAFMFAAGGIWYSFWVESNTFVRVYTITLVIIGLLAFTKSEKIKSWNNYIKRRIEEYEHTQKIPPNDF